MVLLQAESFMGIVSEVAGVDEGQKRHFIDYCPRNYLYRVDSGCPTSVGQGVDLAGAFAEAVARQLLDPGVARLF